MALVLVSAGVSCAGYKQGQAATKSIYDVKVTTRSADVRECRLIGKVDSRDSSRGCGLTVQPTPEECLRYQVRRAGGDTLLMSGPMGDAYDCSGKSIPGRLAPTAPPAPTLEPPPRPTPLPTNTPAPLPERGVRIVQSREAVKGCVYLDDVDLTTACPGEPGRTKGECAADRAARTGGNVVLVDGDRAQIYSCKAAP